MPAVRELCETIGVRCGDAVLDVACGPGTVTFIAAELGAAPVVGVDFARSMVSLAHRGVRPGGALHFVAGNQLTPSEVPFHADSPMDAWRALQLSAGRIAAASARLDPATHARLDADMIDFFQRFRVPSGGIYCPREALVIRGVRR